MTTVDGVTAPHVIVLFGATGDLARRKLLPGLLRLTQAGLLKQARFVGTSLEDIDTEEFIRIAHDACAEFGKGDLDPGKWALFASMLTYVPQGKGPHELAEAVHKAEADLGADGEVRRLHYLSVPPRAALDVIHQLDEAGLVERSRIIMEKPFGTDLASRDRAQRTRCTRSSTRTRSSGSTTSSARRPRRTSWPSGSPTACSSRSGTATSSSTCRSTCPRPSGSRGAPRSTRRPAPTATWWSPT